MSGFLQGMIGFFLALAAFLIGLGAGIRVSKQDQHRALRRWIEQSACWSCREKFEDAPSSEDDEED